MHKDALRISRQASLPVPILIEQPSMSAADTLRALGIMSTNYEQIREIGRGGFANIGPQQGTISGIYSYSPLSLSGERNLDISALSGGALRYLSLEDLLPTKFDSYIQEIYQSLQQEPVLDGFNHPTEPVLAKAFAIYSEETEQWVLEQIKSSSHPSRTADILRLICRFWPSTPGWRAAIVDLALKSNSIEIRDAAIQAIETWAEAELVDILTSHSEPVSWLSDYATRVIHDLNA